MVIRAKVVTRYASDRFMIKLFICSICLFLIYLLFINIIDPYGISFLHYRFHGLNMYKSNRVDIDKLIKPFEVWRYQPKTIFIGTSRIQQAIDPTVLDGTTYAPAYNASIPASTITMNYEDIKLYISLDPKLKNIFIELFPYSFFGVGQTNTMSKGRIDVVKGYLTMQLSIDAFMDSIKTIYYNNFIRMKYWPTPRYVEPGGNLVQSSSFNAKMTFLEDDFIKNVTTKGGIETLFFVPEAFNSLNKIVQIARKHKIKLHFMVTPIYAWDDARMLILGKWELLETWYKKIADLSDVVTFAQHNTFTEELTDGPKMKYWNDPTHFSSSMGYLMLKSYFNDDMAVPGNFRRLLNGNSVNYLIKERKRKTVVWMNKHHGFCEKFRVAMLQNQRQV